MDSRESEKKRFFKFVLQKYLVPLFKSYGYKRKGNTWSKINRELYVEIKMYKRSYFAGNEIAFSFYVRIARKEDREKLEMTDKDTSLFAWDFENNFHTNQDCFFTPEHMEYKKKEYKWKGYDDWYVIYREELFDSFLEDELEVDLEKYMFPLLEKINTKEILESLVNKQNAMPENKRYDWWYIGEIVDSKE